VSAEPGQPVARSDRLARLRDVLRADVSRETFDRLEAYVALLREENVRQNLVSAATLDCVWERHILDSAQLVRFEPQAGAAWIDLGSGAGLPGIVVACLVKGPVALVEPRRLRAEFLHKAAATLELNVTVHAMKAERVSGAFEVNTARALAL
jgi:16S rRNA (guanine527-N7)-methyltransferase